MKAFLAKPAIEALLLSIGVSVCAGPVPHHFNSIAALPDRTIALSLDGSVSGLFARRPGSCRLSSELRLS